MQSHVQWDREIWAEKRQKQGQVEMSWSPPLETRSTITCGHCVGICALYVPNSRCTYRPCLCLMHHWSGKKSSHCQVVAENKPDQTDSWKIESFHPVLWPHQTPCNRFLVNLLWLPTTREEVTRPKLSQHDNWPKLDAMSWLWPCLCSAAEPSCRGPSCRSAWPRLIGSEKNTAGLITSQLKTSSSCDEKWSLFSPIFEPLAWCVFRQGTTWIRSETNWGPSHNQTHPLKFQSVHVVPLFPFLRLPHRHLHRHDQHSTRLDQAKDSKIHKLQILLHFNDSIRLIALGVA